MAEETYTARLAELEHTIDALPPAQQAQLRILFEETRLRHVAIKTATTASRNALDDWRIAMKYMIFDAEARLRENAR